MHVLKAMQRIGAAYSGALGDWVSFSLNANVFVFLSFSFLIGRGFGIGIVIAFSRTSAGYLNSRLVNSD